MQVMQIKKKSEKENMDSIRSNVYHPIVCNSSSMHHGKRLWCVLLFVVFVGGKIPTLY